ncbi:GNAT family N-acetyltransferase [Pedobacter deserti]|uniref:GNAT family N-acetyltransferase n=1 Tax=Pedobacter deserti TaxID=2817382 RepID=UPI00210A4572|nr:GNAT family N-acetyltransferase [Pedobacter sp. SYSU D00382]
MDTSKKTHIAEQLSNLHTERLRLRQLEFTDALAIFRLRSNAGVNRYLNRKPATTEQDAIDFITTISEHTAIHQLYYWAITLSKTETCVGIICLFNFSKETSSYEIGYEMLPELQGQGLMKEAAQAVIQYAHASLTIKTIYAFSHQHNEKSNRLLTKLGFQKKSSQPHPEGLPIHKFNLNI